MKENKIKCNHCGQEIVELGELTQEQVQDLNYINYRNVIAEQALKNSGLDGLALDQNQQTAYFKAAMELKAESMLLEEAFNQNILQTLGIKEYHTVIDGKVYGNS